MNGQQSRGWHWSLPQGIPYLFQVNSSVCLDPVEEPGQFLDHVLDKSTVLIDRHLVPDSPVVCSPFVSGSEISVTRALWLLSLCAMYTKDLGRSRLVTRRKISPVQELSQGGF